MISGSSSNWSPWPAQTDLARQRAREFEQAGAVVEPVLVGEHEGKRDRLKGEIQEEYGEVKRKESNLERDLDDIDRGAL